MGREGEGLGGAWLWDEVGMSDDDDDDEEKDDSPSITGKALEGRSGDAAEARAERPGRGAEDGTCRVDGWGGGIEVDRVDVGWLGTLEGVLVEKGKGRPVEWVWVVRGW